MTRLLSYLLRRNKPVNDPDYRPPYFWHRYIVWQGLIGAPLYALVSDLLDIVPGTSFWFRDLALALMMTQLTGLVAPTLRQRWARHQEQLLSSKVAAWIDSHNVDDSQVRATMTKLELFSRDLQDYAAYFKYSPLSIRYAAWLGDGTRYIKYRRGHPKQVLTFYHR